jgi:hypothetical protein
MIAVPDAIDRLVSEVEADRLGIVAAADRMEAEFRKMGLLYEMDIAPRQVGFDPCNRDGMGGHAQEVFLLASDIAFVGWSWAETSHALCVETLPGDKSVEDFNRRLSDGVGLAPVEKDSIHFGSISCGHTNYGLRCIAASVASTCPLLSDCGRMSLEKLRRRDPEYALAVVRGLHWKVLRAEVRQRYPKTLPILQDMLAAASCRFFQS